ncbi:ABC transporter ATP-binding protein [Petroclostridium sp. X23]|uniref:energy-coupling factor ABC transporter ATP-binding protein n=1 Tax=Petroclostridium sp. X23 TaxID=3045146 RepID=UPI0024AD204B|nr:ABC transporter ATP-binding protein [Petroclostridium sp. X23]WHH60328.1 ABC transporter ATP-binding protein [Petroclostridium sp. X23]
MIKIENLTFGYIDGKDILKDISLHIRKGEFVAFVGQNGAGKTTLLKHFNGLLKPTGGKVMVKELDTRRHKTSRLAQHIGFLFQNPDHQIFCNTVYEEIAFGLKVLKLSKSDMETRIKKAAKRVGLEEFLDVNPFSLSKGQRQRVALASILALDVDIIVLDEPTTGQDYQESIEIMEMIQELNTMGKTIIMVTHDMELVAKYASRAVILSGGVVLEDGRPEEVFVKHESVKQAKLSCPQILSLAQKFHKKGYFKDMMTAEQMYEQVIYLIEGEKNAGIG